MIPKNRKETFSFDQNECVLMDLFRFFRKRCRFYISIYLIYAKNLCRVEREMYFNILS